MRHLPGICARRLARRGRAHPNLPGRPGRWDRGSASLELSILAPVMLLLIGFVVVAGRVAVAGAAVTSIAGNAARDASLARDARGAAAAASSSARSSLTAQDLHCVGGGDVSLDPSGFPAAARGGGGQSVVVTVTCIVSFSDLGLPGLPGSRTLTDQAVSPIDPNRATNAGVSP